jgi:hypothetical protein
MGAMSERKNMTGLPLAERIARQSEAVPSGCVEWTGKQDKDGYGRIWWERRGWRAHRLTYIQAHGPVAPNIVVRHKCDNPPCVRLDHLEMGTVRDNYQDMLERRGRDHMLPAGRVSGALKRAMTHCQRGHAFDDGNTYWRKGIRQCRTCRYDAWKRWYERSQAKKRSRA